MTRELRVYATRGRADDFRMCLGSLYRRNAASEIRAIVRAVAAVLPDLSLHLFGIKLGPLRQAGRLPDAVASLDSAARPGRFGRDLDRCTDEQRRTCTACRAVVRPRLGPGPTVCPRCGGALGASQREYTVLIALPRYRARVERRSWRAVEASATATRGAPRARDSRDRPSCPGRPNPGPPSPGKTTPPFAASLSGGHSPCI